MNWNIKWKWTELPLSRDDILSVQDKLGLTFPENFVKLVLQNNAGYPNHRYFDIGNRKDLVFEHLLNLKHDGEAETLMQVYSDLRDRLPKNVIPFAMDSFGNFICFDFRNDQNDPDIVFWDHELDNKGDPQTILKIDENLSDFLNTLRS